MNSKHAALPKLSRNNSHLHTKSKLVSDHQQSTLSSLSHTNIYLAAYIIFVIWSSVNSLATTTATSYYQQMMLTETMREATHNPKQQLSFFSSFCGVLSAKKNDKKAKANPLQVPRDLPTLCTTPAEPSSCSMFKRVFRQFDGDGDGKISPSELTDCMRTVGEELSAEDAEAAVMFVDSDGDGLLGFDDFLKLVEVEEEEEKGRNLREAFGVYEMEGEGCITPKSLRSTLERLGQSRSAEECEAMIRRFDLDGDGVISFDEFRVMML